MKNIYKILNNYFGYLSIQIGHSLPKSVLN
jgi:hypothetical protein